MDSSRLQTDLSFVVSPSILFNGSGWEAWGHDHKTHLMHHYVTSNLINWTESESMSLTIPYNPYHSEVKLYNQYQMLIQTSNKNKLYYFNSTDGITWVGIRIKPGFGEQNRG